MPILAHPFAAMKRIAISSIFLLLPLLSWAQSTFIPYNPDYYHLIDRFQIKFQNKQNLLPVTNKPVRRSDLATFLNHVKDSYDSLSVQDQYNLRYLLNDNWNWTKSEHNVNDKNWYDLMYVKRSDFYYYKTNDFTLRVNPVGYFTGGQDSDIDGTLFTNTRGLEAIGTIDNKIGFYTFLTTTQARFPRYVFDFIRAERQAFPNEGFWKRQGQTAWDLTHARGYISFAVTKSIDVQAGYDKHFIGNGMRSMILSDFSSPYLFMKLSTRLGPFQYTNLFAELTADIQFGNLDPGDGDYPNKYMAYHRLSVNVTPNFELGLYETVFSSRASLDYFNPIVFYRAIEQHRGSPDNISLGMDFRWNIRNQFSLYGQFILDEFFLEELTAGDGSFRNKFGFQLGGKYIDAFDIPTLDLQAEVNLARPFLYAHEDPLLSYSNYRNPLAHPLGANFKELVLSARYQPINKFRVSGLITRSNQGLDDGITNFGGDVLASTSNLAMERGHTIGQGVSTKTTYVELTGSYQLMHNIFVDAQLIYRDRQSDDPARSLQSFLPMLSLRWNVTRRQHVF